MFAIEKRFQMSAIIIIQSGISNASAPLNVCSTVDCLLTGKLIPTRRLKWQSFYLKTYVIAIAVDVTIFMELFSSFKPRV